MANRDPELSERPEGAFEHEPVAVIAPATAEVLGVPLALTDYERTLDWLDATVAARQQGYVCVCNVHTVMSSAEDQGSGWPWRASPLTVPDGERRTWALTPRAPPLPT